MACFSRGAFNLKHKTKNHKSKAKCTLLIPFAQIAAINNNGDISGGFIAIPNQYTRRRDRYAANEWDTLRYDACAGDQLKSTRFCLSRACYFESSKRKQCVQRILCQLDLFHLQVFFATDAFSVSNQLLWLLIAINFTRQSSNHMFFYNNLIVMLIWFVYSCTTTT